MIERFKRRLMSERGSVYLEYALVTSLTIGLAAVLLDPSSSIFAGIGYDYTFREVLIKLPIF